MLEKLSLQWFVSNSNRAEVSSLAGNHHTAFHQHPHSLAGRGESCHMAAPALRNHAGNPLQRPAAAHSRQRCPACLQYHHTPQEGSLEECFGEGNSDHSHEEKTEGESKRAFKVHIKHFAANCWNSQLTRLF